MADDLSALFGIPQLPQVPWTDRNSQLAGGAGATPQQPNMAYRDATPAQLLPQFGQGVMAPGGGFGGPTFEGFPLSSTGASAATPIEANPMSGMSPRLIQRIPDQPPRATGGAIPIPAQSFPAGGAYRPVGSPTGMGDIAGSTDDLDAVTRTMLAEARANPTPSDLASIAHAIRNRQAMGYLGATSPYGVVHHPGQFEPWGKTGSDPISNNDPTRFDPSSRAYQDAQSIAKGVWDGQIADPVRGATHFFSPSGQSALGRGVPAWGQGTPLASVGGHEFFAPDGKPTADQLAKVPPLTGGGAQIAGGGTGATPTLAGMSGTPGAGTGMGGLSSDQFKQLMGVASQGGGPKVNLLGQLLFGNKGLMGQMPQSIQEHGILGGLGSAFQGGGGRTPVPPPDITPNPGVAAPPSIVPTPLSPQGPGVVPIPAISGAPQNAPQSAGNGPQTVMRPGGVVPVAPDWTGPIQQAPPVNAGQSNPHMPGFDPKSVPFINTPVGGNAAGAGSIQGMAAPGAGGGPSEAQLSLLAQLMSNPATGAGAAGSLGGGGAGLLGGGGGGGLIGGLAGLFA